MATREFRLYRRRGLVTLGVPGRTPIRLRMRPSHINQMAMLLANSPRWRPVLNGRWCVEVWQERKVSGCDTND
jgi:hypothetical protein